ncbi:MAG: hypothetical protein GYB31_19765 [Bacteroidetes bacterium]|nr:hypothetical protein [Bacteroidota bacterium]
MKTETIFLLPLLLLLAACNSPQTDSIPNTPVEFKYFRLNYEDFGDLDDLKMIGQDEYLHLQYSLVDEGSIEFLEVFFYINSDFSKRVDLYAPNTPMQAEFNGVHFFEDVERFYLKDSQKYYETQSGDRLYFYINAEDDDGNESEWRFQLEIE